MTGGEMVLEAFNTNDIDYIFCSPGTEWVTLLEELARRYHHGGKAPRYINCRHESLAVSMALGYARVTGRLSVVLLHSSVGSLHAAMEIRAAYHDAAPLLICSGDASSGSEHSDPLASWIWLSRLADTAGVESMVRDYVKWSKRASSVEDIQDAVCRGCQIAREAPGGPVFIAFPWSLLVSPVAETGISSALSPAILPSPRPDELKEVARLLVDSEQPVIITEYGGRSPEAVASLVELAELLAAPVSEGVDPLLANFPAEHPLYMGDQVDTTLEEADVVLLVGVKTPWYPPAAFPGKGARVILLDEDPLKTRLPSWGYRVDMKLGGDIELVLDSLTRTVKASLDSSDRSRYQARLPKWQRKHKQMVREWSEVALADEKSGRFTARWLLYQANKLLPENRLIVDETVMHLSLVHQYLASPGGYLRVGTGGLGVGLGQAVGAKLACPERLVVFLVGDGTYNYNPVLAGLGACQEYRLPILTIVLNNGGYSGIQYGYRKYCPQGWAVRHNSYLGVNIEPRPDYVGIGEALGAAGYRITKPDDVIQAFTGALEQLARGRSAIIDVVLDELGGAS